MRRRVWDLAFGIWGGSRRRCFLGLGFREDLGGAGYRGALAVLAIVVRGSRDALPAERPGDCLPGRGRGGSTEGGCFRVRAWQLPKPGGPCRIGCHELSIVSYWLSRTHVRHTYASGGTFETVCLSMYRRRAATLSPAPAKSLLAASPRLNPVVILS